MEYQLSRQSDSLWRISDDGGQVLFEGGLTACEAWLDQQEAVSQKSWAESITSFFKKRSSKDNPAPQEVTPSDSHHSFRITG